MSFTSCSLFFHLEASWNSKQSYLSLIPFRKFHCALNYTGNLKSSISVICKVTYVNTQRHETSKQEFYTYIQTKRARHGETPKQMTYGGVPRRNKHICFHKPEDASHSSIILSEPPGLAPDRRSQSSWGHWVPVLHQNPLTTQDLLYSTRCPEQCLALKQKQYHPISWPM